MGNSQASEEIIIKCSLEEMVKHFFKDYIVIWHDPNVNSQENQQYIAQLRKFCGVLTFTEWEKALISIKEATVTCHVITSGTNGEFLVKEISSNHTVSNIYIFCKNKEYHSSWAKNYPKISCIETNIQNLINQIQQNLLEWYKQASSLKMNLPAFAPIFDDIDKSQMNHLHRYLKVIPNFENRVQAKKDFLALSKTLYSDPNNTKLIADFERYYNEYNKTQTLRWYTLESFLYKVTNNCLRIATADSIQYCRLLLKDIEQAIKEQYQTKSKHFNGLLYRGAYLSSEEWSNLKENQDKEIEMHGFLSVSKEKNVALSFMQTDPNKKVLITILVPKGPNEEEQGFAEIEEFSQFPQEKEILFNVRSRFTVIETEEEYSSESPYRHLVLLYGAQGFRKFTAEQNPLLKVPTPNIQDISCCHCTQGTPEGFLLRPLDKQIYYCKNCIDKSSAAVLLCVPLQNTLTVPEISVKGSLIVNSTSMNIPFYGYKCSQCQSKKQKFYFICTDCSCQKKLLWCESCFPQAQNCIQAQHTILLETHPFSFWCEKMSESELNHIRFQNDFISENNDSIFRQAEMYYASHNYDKAIKYYTLYLQRSKTKIRDPNRGTAFGNLGSAYWYQKEYQKALECHLQALEFDKSLFSGSDRSELASSYGNVGSAYNYLEEYAKAIEYYSKALDIFKSLHQKKDVAITYLNIGVAYKSQGDYPKALEYYFKALEIHKSAQRENLPSIASCYGHIAFAFQKQKEHAKALEYHLKSLEIKKSLYGENHPEVATSYSNLASIFSNQGEYDKAFEYKFKALDIQKAVYGKNSPQIADEYCKIGSFYKDRKESTKALEVYWEALEIQKSLYGENHPSVATAYKNIATVFSNQGEYSKALEYYVKTLNIRKSLYGENHADVATSFNNLASIFEKQGEHSKALEYYVKALDIRKSLYGENHSDIVHSYDSIGHMYLEQKEDTKALESFEKCLEIRKLSCGENSGEIAICYYNIGKALTGQGEYIKAEEFLLKAMNIEKTIFGEKSPQIAFSYYQLAGVYLNQKEYTKALEYCLKSLEIRKSVLEKDHPETIKTQNRVIEIQSLCL